MKLVRVVENGNLYVPDYREKKGFSCQKLDDGRDVVINITGETVMVKKSYWTANGRCDDVILAPGQGFAIEQYGDPYQFQRIGVYE